MVEKDREIAITDILQIMWMNKFLILILACLTATVLLVQTVYFTPPEYVADGMMYISNKTEQTVEIDKINKNDIDTSRTLSYTYIEILKSRSFLTMVSEAVGGAYSWKEIKGMLSVASLNETELLKVNVKADNAADASNIARAVLEKAPEKLSNILNGGTVEIVDAIDNEATLVDAGVAKRTALGFAAGAFAGALIAFLRNLFDKKVHKGEDVSKRYNVFVLGSLNR